jgi:hypothetical protein
MSLAALLGHYGYLAVFVGTFVEGESMLLRGRCSNTFALGNVFVGRKSLQSLARQLQRTLRLLRSLPRFIRVGGCFVCVCLRRFGI